MFQDVHWLARRLDAKGFSFCISFLGALVRSTNCNVELKRSLTRFFQLQSVVDVLVYLMYTISTWICQFCLFLWHVVQLVSRTIVFQTIKPVCSASVNWIRSLCVYTVVQILHGISNQLNNECLWLRWFHRPFGTKGNAWCIWHVNQLLPSPSELFASSSLLCSCPVVGVGSFRPGTFVETSIHQLHQDLL